MKGVRQTSQAESKTVKVPWDEPAIDARLLTAAKIAREEPLAQARHTASTAAYLLYYHGDLGIYEAVVSLHKPIYVGSAKNIRRRLGDHRSSIRSVASLDVADFAVRLVGTPTHDVALYAESRLNTLYRPVWNLAEFAGFGSKHQGLGRIAAQNPSPWDTLHPGRAWARKPSREQRKRLLERLALWEERTVGDAPMPQAHPTISGR